MLTEQMTDADKEKTAAREDVCTLRPAGPFCSGAVLQRRKLIPIWGKAAPRSRIECTLGTARAVTFAGDDGSFLLKLPPMEAADDLTLFLSDGKNETAIDNIAVGEVFLIAGQSNMEYDLTRVPDEEIPVLRHPVRCCRFKPAAFPARAADVTGSWQDHTAKKGFSAVGFFFAARISREMDVPVGLLNASRGGVGAETFVSEYQLACDPFYGKLLADYEAQRFLPENNPESSGEELANSTRLTRAIREYAPELPPLAPELQGWEQLGYDDSNWQTQELPGSWNLAGHPHTGVFLYRKTIELPERFRGRELLFSPGICDRADECFINGQCVGSTGKPNSLQHWNTVRRYTVPAELAQEKLVIAVKVAAFCSICTFGGLVGPAKEMKITCGEEEISLTGTWRLAEAADTGCTAMDSMTSTGSGEIKSFHTFYDNVLFPIGSFAVNGVLWYQGEANTLNFAEKYGSLQRGVIRTFRELFRDPRLPVIVILLPGFQQPLLHSPHSKWAVIRDQQTRVTLEETGHPPVNICDCGDVDDIHPPEKRIPGERAADFYLALAAGKTPPRGALCIRAEYTPDEILLHFDTAGFPLTGETGSASGIVGVTAAGEAVPLEISRLTADTISLVLPGKELAEIAYGWSDNPGSCRLSNTCGIPAYPFKLTLEK